MAGGGNVMAIVKANGYGHGLEAVAKLLCTQDVSFFGVANVGEARRIRDAGVHTPIFLLGPAWSGEREEIVVNRWIPCISSLGEAAAFDALAKRHGRRLRVHLGVDTGMGRSGFVLDDIPDVFPRLRRLGNLEFEGICSHLACADSDRAFTDWQFGRFREILAELGGAAQFRWRHIANSAGVLGYDGAPCNLLRMGLMVYGVSPLPGFQEKLSTVMSLKSRVIAIQEIVGDTSLRRLALIGAGYGDGYPAQACRSGGEVSIKGRRFPISGRIMIDQLTVDVTADPSVAEGDEVELFGDHVPVSEVAAKSGSIAWEVLAGISSWVERIYAPADPLLSDAEREGDRVLTAGNFQ